MNFIYTDDIFTMNSDNMYIDFIAASQDRQEEEWTLKCLEVWYMCGMYKIKAITCI